MNVVARLRALRVPAWLGPAAVLLITAIGVFGVVWGIYRPLPIEVVQFDAGEASAYAPHRVVAFPERHLYLVRMADGRIRAIDGRVQGSDCRVEWLPEDPRGAARNPQGLPGVFRDPCSEAIWSFEGNAISGTKQPLRTPQVTLAPGAAGGVQRVTVELVNPSR